MRRENLDLEQMRFRGTVFYLKLEKGINILLTKKDKVQMVLVDSKT